MELAKRNRLFCKKAKIFDLKKIKGDIDLFNEKEIK